LRANANSGIVAKSINTGTTGILVESFSSTGLSLRNQGGTGDLLNAAVELELHQNGHLYQTTLQQMVY
jgi:hypothetical protein